METLAALLTEFPRAQVIVMSGGSAKMDVDYLKVALSLGASKAFRKPFELRELCAAVRELARASALPKQTRTP